jgi:hypothetical protein
LAGETSADDGDANGTRDFIDNLLAALDEAGFSSRSRGDSRRQPAGEEDHLRAQIKGLPGRFYDL